MDLKTSIASLKNIQNHANQIRLFLTQHNWNAVIGTSSDVKDFQQCVLKSFEKCIDSATDSLEFRLLLVCYLDNVPTTWLTKARGKVFKYLLTNFDHELWARLWKTAAPTKQSSEWQKMWTDCLKIIEDIYEQEVSGITDPDQIIISTDSSLQTRSLDCAGWSLVELLKCRPKGTQINIGELLKFALNPKKAYLNQHVTAQLLTTLILKIPRFHLAPLRSKILDYAQTTSNYTLISQLLTIFGTTISNSLFTNAQTSRKINLQDLYAKKSTLLVDLIAFGGVPLRDYTTVQADVIRDLWEGDTSDIEYKVRVFNAMVLQPVAKLRPLQVAEKIYSRILTSATASIEMKNCCRLGLQMVAASLQPITKSTNVEIAVESRPFTGSSNPVAVVEHAPSTAPADSPRLADTPKLRHDEPRIEYVYTSEDQPPVRRRAEVGRRRNSSPVFGLNGAAMSGQRYSQNMEDDDIFMNAGEDAENLVGSTRTSIRVGGSQKRPSRVSFRNSSTVVPEKVSRVSSDDTEVPAVVASTAQAKKISQTDSGIGTSATPAANGEPSVEEMLKDFPEL